MERQKQTAHHLLFYEKDWSARPEAKYLREQGGLIAMLSRPDHDEVHRQVALVPMFAVHALQRVASEHRPVSSVYANIDNFVLLTEKALQHRRTTSLEKRLGLLTIEAMLEQKDIIKELRKRP